jgi:hypothetical protein
MGHLSQAQILETRARYMGHLSQAQILGTRAGYMGHLSQAQILGTRGRYMGHLPQAQILGTRAGYMGHLRQAHIFGTRARYMGHLRQAHILGRWFGHVARMSESGYPRMAWEVRYEGRRTRGRPRIKWQDNIQNALLEKGVDWRQARSRAQDRKIWHALCRNSTLDGRRGSTK